MDVSSLLSQRPSLIMLRFLWLSPTRRFRRVIKIGHINNGWLMKKIIDQSLASNHWEKISLPPENKLRENSPHDHGWEYLLSPLFIFLTAMAHFSPEYLAYYSSYFFCLNPLSSIPDKTDEHKWRFGDNIFPDGNVHIPLSSNKDRAYSLGN